MGARKTVISWLGYGVPMVFQSEPGHLKFKNPTMSPEEEAFVDAEVKQHMEDETFVEIPVEMVKTCNPTFVDITSGKMRRIDDERYINAFLASPILIFKYMSLKEDIPTLVKPGDELLVRDLSKAYYKVPMSEEAQFISVSSGKGNTTHPGACS